MRLSTFACVLWAVLHAPHPHVGHHFLNCMSRLQDYDMVQKVTIIPRSNGAGGLAFFAPSEARLELAFTPASILKLNSQLLLAAAWRRRSSTATMASPRALAMTSSRWPTLRGTW